MTALRDIMSTDVDFCTVEDNIYEAAVKMKEHGVGVIPVLDNGQLVGVITDRDIVIRCVAGKKPNSTRITDVMSTHLITGTSDMLVDEAEELMGNEQIRRLPIVENGKLIGIIALGDLAMHKQTSSEAGIALSSISEDRDEMQH
ncbi:CBS domain-containing protein [Peribacillus muralis]|uniref:CBS domain-containing protein n=1 Tax=Peribacillus muralis TaxID=264697 RepID=UPI001F4D8573|nr:CBS domain-containing protein [Peribacillus muralis]MCK1991015.1 CBS domain-containing protein [Peribacillus muralis]MCK2011569.1 CBS domain-containing protein [Peribacillus muralis]